MRLHIPCTINPETAAGVRPHSFSAKPLHHAPRRGILRVILHWRQIATQFTVTDNHMNTCHAAAHHLFPGFTNALQPVCN